MTSNTTRRPETAHPQRPRAAARDRVRTERRHTLLLRAGVAGTGLLAVAGLVTLGALTGKQATPSAAKGAAGSPSTAAAMAATGRSDLAPWPNASNPVDAIKAAGLVPAGAEGAAEHFHAHLDVIIDGKAVPVAAQVGADDAAGLISPLHTHDASGIVHIEAPTVGTPYYLGQLFREWDVALGEHQLGGYHSDSTHTLTAYVNGKATAGNPAAIRLAAHQEIALVYTITGRDVPVPADYDFGEL